MLESYSDLKFFRSQIDAKCEACEKFGGAYEVNLGGTKYNSEDLWNGDFSVFYF